MSVTRFGVSLDEDLLISLDEYVRDNRFANRSQAIRHLIEKHLSEEKWKCDNFVAGVVSLVYSFQKKDIRNKIDEIQHAHRNEILSAQNFHLNDTVCMELIAVSGPSNKLTEISEKLISIKGIHHGKLVMSRV